MRPIAFPNDAARRNPVSRRVPKVCFLVAGALWLAAAPPCAAAIEWDLPWEVKVNGQRLSVEMFTSRMPPDAVMRDITRRNAAYERYLVADGRILLTGVARGTHWLAEIHGHPQGTHGYVSALYFDPSRSTQANLHAMVTSQATEADMRLPTHVTARHDVRRLFEFDGAAAVRMIRTPNGSAESAYTAETLAGDAEWVLPGTGPYPGIAVALSLPEP